MSNYQMFRGDSLILEVEVTYKSGTTTVPLDLTNGKMWMTAKNKFTDSDVNAVFSVSSPTDITFTDPLAGKARIVVPGSATTALSFGADATPIQLVYDIQVKTALGVVQTVATGKISVIPDVTESQA